MTYLLYVSLVISVLHFAMGGHPKGHLESIGSHQPPEGDVDTVEGFLEPEEFFNKYVRPHRPVIFKGAAKSFPAYERWHDQYLRENFGDLPVEVEHGKIEVRERGKSHMTLASFLGSYNDSKMYLVSDIPKEMREELSLPGCLSCGGFSRLLELALLWLSSGGTKSVLHVDDSDNIHCLLDGSKHFFILHRRDSHRLRENPYDFENGYSLVNVNRVDMYQFPVFRDLSWWRADLKKGDCLYLPTEWPHHVHGFGPRNMAINLFFGHLKTFNRTDCTNEAPSTALSEHHVSELFLVKNKEIMEFMSTQIFIELAEFPEIKFKDMMSKYGKNATALELARLFEELDSNNDAVVTWPEIDAHSMADLIEKFPFLLPRPPPNILEALDHVDAAGDIEKPTDGATIEQKPEEEIEMQGHRGEEDQKDGQDPTTVYSDSDKRRDEL